MAGQPDHQLPVITFNFEDGSSDLHINGEKQDFWLPTMFTHTELFKCNIIEPELTRNMIMVQVQDDLQPINPEVLKSRFIEDLSMMDYKQSLMNGYGDKDTITAGLYVEFKNSDVEKWAIFTTGRKKRGKTNVPKQWSEIGLHSGENTTILFDVIPNRINFMPNSSVSQWMAFDF